VAVALHATPASATVSRRTEGGRPARHRRQAATTSENTQIYEGTNQIQRVVMARQLLQ
jgi:hypothetical protein